MRVLKFPLAIADSQQVMMPAGASALHVGVQSGYPCLWALCDAMPLVSHTIYVCGTGHAVPHSAVYVGTFMMHEGGLEFHVFAEP